MNIRPCALLGRRGADIIRPNAPRVANRLRTVPPGKHVPPSIRDARTGPGPQPVSSDWKNSSAECAESKAQCGGYAGVSLAARLASSHLASEVALSPDGRPNSRFSVLMSSSRAGQ